MIVDVAAGSATAISPRADGAAPPGSAARGTGREVDERLCAASGCSMSLAGARPGARYCSGACRTRAWKERTGYHDTRRGKASRNASPSRARPPSLRISYRKAADVVEAELATLGVFDPAGRARDLLLPLLSEKARRFA